MVDVAEDREGCDGAEMTEIHTHAWIPRLHMYIWYGGYIVVGLVPRLPWMDL